MYYRTATRQLCKNFRAFLGLLTILIPVFLWMFVEIGRLWTLALWTFVAAMVGFVVVQACVNRLNAAMRQLLALVKEAQPLDRHALPLKPFEQLLLGVQGVSHPGRLRRVLKMRRRVLNAIAIGFVFFALIAFILLVAIYTY